MPDLKTEMSKVLNAWEQDEHDTLKKPMAATPNGKKLWSVTNNVTRATFEYVQQHPAHTGEQIRQALVAKGFKANSVSSLLAQYVRQGMLSRDSEGKYRTIVSEYTRLKTSKRLPPPTQRKSKIVTSPRTPHTAGIAALKVEPASAPAPSLTGVNSSVVSAWDAETVINNIGLKQAHALYKELGKYFNG
jgi:hypothetical protein